MILAVIGLGSMGKRRIRLLKRYIEALHGADANWGIVGIDMQEERCEECRSLFEIETCNSIQDAASRYNIEAAVISTSPLSHGSIISQCLDLNLHVFTEINLVLDYYDNNIEVAKQKGRVLFLSSTFMYRKEIQYIKKWIYQNGGGGMYRYHVGQYLPEWHPWENYKDFFVSDKRTNACRELFAIELPWLLDIFGDVVNISMEHNKISNLSIEYDDCYHVILKHKSGTIGCITVDVVTPVSERKFEYWKEHRYISWGGHPDNLVTFDYDEQNMEKIDLYDAIEHEKGYNQFIVENAYYDELVEFIDAIEKGITPRYSFEKDKRIIELIERIER